MAKASFILIIASICSILGLAFVSSPTSWIVVSATLAGTAALFAWTIARVNSSFWIRTLWLSDRQPRAVALTFDDGPDVQFTSRVLEILAEKHVPATFFVVGQRVTSHPELVRRAHQMGHVIGNHTTTHSLLFHFYHWGG